MLNRIVAIAVLAISCTAQAQYPEKPVRLVVPCAPGGVTDTRARSWVGILAPAKTPGPIIEKLNRELNAVLASPETIEKLLTLGIRGARDPGGVRGANQEGLREERPGGESRRHQGRLASSKTDA